MSPRPALLQILLICLAAVSFSSAHAEEIKSGIYRLGMDLDQATIDMLKDELHDIERHKEPVTTCPIDYTKHKYINFIADAAEVQFAVVAQDKENTDGRPHYQVILLNKEIPKYVQHVSYYDNVKRKYLDLSFAVEVVSDTESWYTYDRWMKGFFRFFEGLKKFAETEDYQPIIINNREYDDRFYHEYHTFYTSPDAFYLKSHQIRRFNEPVKYLETNNSYYTKTPAPEFYITEQQLAIFTLVQEKNYSTILPIQKSVIFHKNGESSRLNPGDFLAITAEDDEYYHGDIIFPSGEISSGKVFIDDLTDGIHKKMQSNNLTLDVMYFPETSESETPGHASIDRIKIYDNKGRLIQMLKAPGSIVSEEVMLEEVDANFDGFMDLEVFSHDGGAGPNNGNNYYLFDPKTGHFAYHKELSELTQTSISTADKTIYSGWRDGCCIHGNETYKWVDGELTLVESYETRYIDEKQIIETHQFLVDGKMKEETRTITESELRKTN